MFTGCTSFVNVDKQLHTSHTNGVLCLLMDVNFSTLEHRAAHQTACAKFLPSKIENLPIVSHHLRCLALQMEQLSCCLSVPPDSNDPAR